MSVGKTARKIKDLTLRGLGRRIGDKEVVLSDGSIKVVPYKQWEFTILRNPTGATAMRAKAKKDPDLEKIKIGTVTVGQFLDAPVVNAEERQFLPKRRPVKDLRPTSRSTEKAKEQGFVAQEEGKGLPFQTIKPLGGEKKKEEEK